jgi:hypothetical protein
VAYANDPLHETDSPRHGDSYWGIRIARQARGLYCVRVA